MLRDLASKGFHDAPELNSPGWWQRPERLLIHTPVPPRPSRFMPRLTYFSPDLFVVVVPVRLGGGDAH